MKNLCDAAESSEPKEQEPAVPQWMAPDYGESLTGNVQLLHGLLTIKSKSIQTFCLLCAHRGGTSCTSGGGGQGRGGGQVRGGGGGGGGRGGPTSQRGGTITAALHHRRRTCVSSTPIHRPGQERSECIFDTLNGHPFIITIIDKWSINTLVNSYLTIKL